MKTFGKKLISLMLVALMLVAAVPFGVFAEEVDTQSDEGNAADIPALQDNVATLYVTVSVEWNNNTYTKSGYGISSDYTFDKDDAPSVAVATAAMKATGLPNSSEFEVEAATLSDGVLTLTVKTTDAHENNHKNVRVEIEDNDVNHSVECSVCGEKAGTEPHDYKVTSKGDASGHVMTCSKCGHEFTVAHGAPNEKATVTEKKEATCTATGTEKKTVYACGYVEGGETIPKADHNFVDGKCTVCGTYDSDTTTTYYVTIQYKTKKVVEKATLALTPAEVNKILNASATNGAKIVLGKAEGADSEDDKIISAYYGSSTIFTNVAFSGNNIVITVTKDLSSQVSSDTVTVDVVDGNETEQRVLTVGAKYFNLGLALTNSNNKTLASIRVTDTDGVSRTIRSTDTGSDSKVKLHDAIVELLWDAKEVTIEFYRHGGNGAKKVDTMTIRAGEAISGLPLLDGKYVTWYLESGELLQEGRTYDFKSTTVKAYPSTNGDVYLMIYKNGDTKTPVRSNPENITAYVQNNGLISVKDLKTVVENVVGKKGTAYLFDFDGWENYKATKSTKDSADTFDVGTADSRTGVQFLYVMVTGASGSSNADSSNPKTGDTAMIGTATAVLAVAALGLGTATVVLKKKEEF